MAAAGQVLVRAGSAGVMVAVGGASASAASAAVVIVAAAGAAAVGFVGYGLYRWLAGSATWSRGSSAR